jgi:putative DNA primase/helicase
MTTTPEAKTAITPNGNHTMLRAALEWRLIAPVFPLSPGTKIPFAGSKGLKDATQFQDTITKIWNKYPDANIGLVCNGLLVMDLDVKSDGLSDGKPALVAKYGDLPKTRVHRTGSGGEHWIYSVPTDLNIRPGAGKYGFKGMDIRANDSYILVPPSVNESGPYTVIDDSPIAPAPAWLIELAKPKTPTKSTTTSGTGAESIPSGQRNDALTRFAGTIRAKGMGQTVIEQSLLAANREQCNPPLDDNEVLGIARSISRYQARDISKVSSFNFTDSENAEYFTEMYADKLRYDHRRGRWLEWAGHYWRTDNDGQITRLALKAIRERYQHTTEIQDLKQREIAAGKAIASEQRAKLASMLAIAQDLKPIADTGENWDSNPYLFATSNAVIDLRTGQPIPGNQADMITMISPVKYEPAATCPRWEQFQREIHPDNPELVNWKQKYFGYGLSGLTKEQILAMGLGGGSNGKTVEQNSLEYVFGEYSYNAPFTMFELNERSSIPNDIAALNGKRFVTARETTEGSRFNEGRIKALTGGDSITARFLHGEWFTFNPTAKYLLAVNSKPRVHDQSYGFWRRVKLIPYLQQFNGDKADKNLNEILRAEASGILNWLIKGFLVWQIEGLEPAPECITVATHEYEAESDPVADFLMDKCIINDQARIQASKLFKSYTDYCHDQGMRDKEILGVTAFGRRMAKNYKKSHDRAGTFYQGLALECDEFVTGFEPVNTFSQLNSKSIYARENNMENTSQPVTRYENPSQPKNEEIGELPE